MKLLPIIKIGTWSWFPKGIIGMTLFPFIFIDEHYKKTVDEKVFNVIINHEKIHFYQQIEMFILFFYIWYGLEYLMKLVTYGKGAYMALSFEREAYANELNFDYSKTRKFWNFVKYINHGL